MRGKTFARLIRLLIVTLVGGHLLGRWFLALAATQLPTCSSGVPATQSLMPNRNRYLRWWLIPISLGLVVSMVGTGWLLVDLRRSGSLPSISGGLLFFIDAGDESADVEADVATNLARSGFPGLDTLTVEITFARPQSTLHWYIIASGQYVIPNKTPIEDYCIGYSKAQDGEVVCPGDYIVASSSGVHYEKGGLGVSDNGTVHRLEDYDGYDDTRTSLIEGYVAGNASNDPLPAVVSVRIPIAKIRSSQVGSETYESLAPAPGINQGDYGEGPVVNNVQLPAAAKRRGQGDIVTVPSGHLLQPLDIKHVKFTVSIDANFQEIAFAQPAAASPSELVWTDLDIREAGIHFILNNPRIADRLQMKTFFAGITSAIAVGMLFLLLEPYLRRRAGLER